MHELSREESLTLLAEEQVAHVATAVEGVPYVTPISYVVIGEEVAFRTVPGRRLDELQSNPRVCIEVSRTDDEGGWQSVLVWGDAYVVDDANKEADVVAALLGKYHEGAGLFSVPASRPFDPRPLVVAVPVDEITGRTSGRGFTPGTRPGRL